MTTSIITKKIIAQSLKTLMRKKDFQKISVSHLMHHCQMQRQTFYYHFQDKYALLTFIYQSETKERIRDFLDYQHWHTILYDLFIYFYDEQSFYKDALNITEQNNFGDYLFEELYTLFKHAMTELNQSKHNEHIDYCARFLAHGFVEMTKDWLLFGCKTKPEVMRDIVYDLLCQQLNLSSEKAEGENETYIK